MKLHSVEVEVDPHTYEPELKLSVSIPITVYDGIDTMDHNDIVQALGQELLDVVMQAKAILVQQKTQEHHT